VLEFSKDAIEDKLAQLAREIGFDKDATDQELAQQFITEVFALRKRVGVPDVLDTLKKEDIKKIAKEALKETHAQYAVPKYMDQKTCEALIENLLP